MNDLIGILAEKPDQARDFAKALGGMKGTYDGQQYVIANSIGHLFEYKQPYDMVPKNLRERYKSWNLKYLPWNANDFDFYAYQIKKDRGQNSYFRRICNAFNDCDEIVIATDNDPTGEGEKLAWEILYMGGFKPKKWSRMYFDDSASKKAVQDAFINRVPKKSMHDDPDMIEAEYRSRFDLISMQWSRIASGAVANHATLRTGRLKGGMVDQVYKRLLAIKNYKKIPAYSQRYEDENGNLFINKDAEMHKNKADVKLDEPGKVALDKTVIKHTVPPKLYNLTKLSSTLEPKGIRTATTLATYQNMYQDHVVSYPRTEDKLIMLSQFNSLLPKVDKIAKLVGVDTSLLTHKAPRMKTHVTKKALDHGANRPGDNVPDNLDSLDEKYGRGAKMIYTILAKNFLAMLAEDYEYEHQTAHVDNNPKYVAAINRPHSLGWKKVFNDGSKADEDKQFGKIAKPIVYTSYPPKPTQPTMDWLFKQLDKYSVGNGATQASTFAIISANKTKKNPYPLLTNSRGKLGLTKYGKWLAEISQGTHIADLLTTQTVNDNMKLLRNGKAGWDDITKWLDDETDMIVSDMKIMLANGDNLRKQEGLLLRPMDEEKITGQWTDKKGKTLDVHFSKDWRGHEWTDEEAHDLLDGKKVKVELTSKAGKPYEMYAFLDHQSFTNDDGKEIKGVWVTGEFAPKTYAVPDEKWGHKFTAEEKKTLNDGGEIEADDLKSKTGKTYSAKITFEEQTYKGHKFKGLKLHFDND